MFLAWLMVLVHAACRPNHRAWVEQLAIAGLAFGLLPLLNLLTTDRGLWHSLVANDWVFVGFDLTVLIVGLMSGWAAWQVWQKRPLIDAGGIAIKQGRSAQEFPGGQL